MSRVDPDRILYLAIDHATEQDIFADTAGEVLVTDYALKLIVVDIALGRITSWRD